MFTTFELSRLFPGGVYRNGITQIMIDRFISANYSTEKDGNQLAQDFAKSPGWTETQIVQFCAENLAKILENVKYATFFKITQEKVAIVYIGEGGRLEVCVTPLPGYMFWAAVFLDLFVINENPELEASASSGH